MVIITQTDLFQSQSRNTSGKCHNRAYQNKKLISCTDLCSCTVIVSVFSFFNKSILICLYIYLYFLLLIHPPVLLFSSFQMAAPSPQALTMQPAGCLTYVQTRSSASTAMTISSVVSPPWLSHALAVCCWLVTMTLTATSGTP